MNYKLYQIQLTEAEYNKINAEGHNSVPKHKAKLDMSFTDKVAELASDAFNKGYYTHVSNIEAEGLEGVFEVGNIGPESAITRLGRMHSVSVADVVETPEGVRHVVASVGFEQLA